MSEQTVYTVKPHDKVKRLQGTYESKHVNAVIGIRFIKSVLLWNEMFLLPQKLG